MTATDSTPQVESLRQKLSGAPLLSTAVVGLFPIFAIVFHDGYKPPWFSSRLASLTYPQVWEFSAVLATILLTFFYWLDQMKTAFVDPRLPRLRLRAHHGRGFCNLCLIFSLIFLLIAASTIYYEKQLSCLLNFRHTDLVALHFWLVLAVACLFAAHDAAAWRSTSEEEGAVTFKFFLFADLPIAVALLCLMIFYIRQPQGITLYQGHDGSTLFTLEYFVAGAIAFPILASDVLYFVLKWEHICLRHR